MNSKMYFEEEKVIIVDKSDPSSYDLYYGTLISSVDEKRIVLKKACYLTSLCQSSDRSQKLFSYASKGFDWEKRRRKPNQLREIKFINTSCIILSCTEDAIENIEINIERNS